MRELNSLLSIFAKMNTISAIVLFAALFYFAPKSDAAPETIESKTKTTAPIHNSAEVVKPGSQIDLLAEHEL